MSIPSHGPSAPPTAEADASATSAAPVSSAPTAPLVWTELDTPVGPLALVGSAAGLREIWFESEAVPSFDPAARREPTDPVFAASVAQLTAYFGGARDGFDLPLDLRGTPFQRQVWAALLAIPLGATRTYGAIAAEITTARPERPTSARAVAAAVGRTPVPIIVPCHRVIGGNGSLTGYRGGLERKRTLLQLEGAAIIEAGAGTPLARASASSGQLPLL